MQHEKLNIENIMQSSILYYDSEVENACVELCTFLKIDNMPSLDGKHYFKFTKGKFDKERVHDEVTAEINDNIFAPAIIKRFENSNHNVLFVFDGKVIKGVVHISDYNKDIVLQTIQDDILSFERKLRHLLLLNGFGNE